MTAAARRTVRLRIRGRVQGVWYRGWTVGRARELGIDGWVRNRMDGSVEALAAGSPEAVSRLIEECHVGPTAARVTGVEVSEDDEPVEPGFRERETD